MQNKLKDEVWIMRTYDGMFYPVQPSEMCKPEEHGQLNPHVKSIEDTYGNVLWERPSN
jgi:hypothetical protein